MQHLFNFVPTVKYRAGSSFIYGTILALLYAIPAFLAAFMFYRLVAVDNVISQLETASAALEEKIEKFRKTSMQLKPDSEETEAMKRRLLTYLRTVETLRFSWNELFRTIENILPPKVRLTRIHIAPKTVLKLTFEGKAQTLEDVTALLRSFYDIDRFANPRLTRHAVLAGPQELGVTFNMDVDYLPPFAMERTQP